MIRYAVKFEGGLYKTQFKSNGEYGTTRDISKAKFYASPKTAKANTENVKVEYGIVKVEIRELEEEQCFSARK